MQHLPRLRRSTLEADLGRYAAVKDPCVVRLGRRWHLFGTGAYPGYRYDILHATAAEPTGPWRLHAPSATEGVIGGCLAAPGVVAQGRELHMFLQTEYNRLGGHVEHLVSHDHGESFRHRDTALTSLPGTGEAGIYDPHPAEIGGDRYLVYSGFAVVGRPDVYLARSVSRGWDGPWERLGPILRHEDVPLHNQHDCSAYEWGLEGPQLVELPDGRVLLNAVGFLGDTGPGDRQRVFLATADDPRGPFEVAGSMLEPSHRPGEIGHASAVVHDGELIVFFQEREADTPWRYGVGRAPLPPAQPRLDAPLDERRAS